MKTDAGATIDGKPVDQADPSAEEEYTPALPTQMQTPCLREAVEQSLTQYFNELGDEEVTGLYQLVLHEVEAPLLKAVLRHTGSNQSKTSTMLGVNRGTLRKKLKQHGLL